MASLDDIWDAPAEVSARASSPPKLNDEGEAFSSGPSRRPKSSKPLFLDSGSEDETFAPAKSRYASKPTSSKPDIDAFFADLDDDPELAFQELAPSLDVNALKKQADAKIPLTPHQIMPSSSPPRDMGEAKTGTKSKAGDKQDKEAGSKKKAKRPKLDESRLLGEDGFPALMKQAKTFKPKGKGHELQDLNRLMNVYQFWAHKMYPNNHFIDTVQRVEKLCHTKRMHIALSVWRDEAKGLINGHKIPGSDDSSDSDSDREAAKNSRLRALEGEGKTGQAAQDRDLPIATDDERSSPSRSIYGASLPPSSPSASGSTLEALDEDFDIDAMIQEEEAARAREAPSSATTSHPAPQSAYGVPRKSAASAAGDRDGNADEDMWDAFMDDVPDEPYVPPTRQPAGASTAQDDIDEDMWDMMREMDESAPSVPPAKPPNPAPAEPVTVSASDGMQPSAEGADAVSVDPPPKATNDEGWDEMYA
ncbi:Swi3-domain-containing protein [Trametes coccinea BRFM310]|uniref:Chromosome segregation in meiosis protein n=1 Tax=Trametes coccinea (strain BRFM310) TaxID=1353009 RepID=A0A1Y2I7N3_TRAC3|nr:Swi3-domain-containing protein [Trametes coccinea BRFM310]